MEFTWALGHCFIGYHWSSFFKSKDLDTNMYSLLLTKCAGEAKKWKEVQISYNLYFMVLIGRKHCQRSWIGTWIPGLVVVAFQMELKIWLFLWERATEAILLSTAYWKWTENDLSHYITCEVSGEGAKNCLKVLVHAFKQLWTLPEEHWVCYWKEFAMVY